MSSFNYLFNYTNIWKSSFNISITIHFYHFSTDTPLATLQKLKERQKESATPYVVLTGNKEQYEQIRK